MDFYVYILESIQDGSYYKGYTIHPAERLAQHNARECSYTSLKVPWVLIYVELCRDKTAALKREKVLKKYAHFQIEQLIRCSKNIVQQFLQGENR